MGKRFKKIYIEITNTCNLNCGFCPKTSRKPEMMSLALFEKIAEEARYLCDEISLHVMGEPLSHPQLKDIIGICEEKDLKINLTTNGTLIKQNSEIRLSKTIRRINFSVHGIKANFNGIKQKTFLKEIIDFTKLAQEKFEDMIITYRLWNINDNSNKEIIKTIEEEFGVEIVEETMKTSTKVKKNLYIHYDESFSWPSIDSKIRSDRGYCHGLTRYVGILVNGMLTPCCLDNDGNINLGNVKDNTIEEILDRKRAMSMKKGFDKRMLIEDMCKKCTYIKRLEKGRDNVNDLSLHKKRDSNDV